jgi:hypothetical protein
VIVCLRPAAFEDPYEAKMAELGQQAAVFSRPSPPAAEIIEKLGLQGTRPIYFIHLSFCLIACWSLHGFVLLFCFIYLIIYLLAIYMVCDIELLSINAWFLSEKSSLDAAENSPKLLHSASDFSFVRTTCTLSGFESRVQNASL